MRGRLSVGFLVAMVAAVAVAWLAVRDEHKSWRWWAEPPVLHAGGRDYQGPGPPTSLAVVRRQGSGVWTTIAREWPMGWPIEASTVPGVDPTVIYLCTGTGRCEPYDLEGGP